MHPSCQRSTKVCLTTWQWLRRCWFPPAVFNVNISTDSGRGFLSEIRKKKTWKFTPNICRDRWFFFCKKSVYIFAGNPSTRMFIIINVVIVIYIFIMCCEMITPHGGGGGCAAAACYFTILAKIFFFCISWLSLLLHVTLVFLHTHTHTYKVVYLRGHYRVYFRIKWIISWRQIQDNVYYERPVSLSLSEL